jgi:hypothetical protein
MLNIRNNNFWVFSTGFVTQPCKDIYRPTWIPRKKRHRSDMWIKKKKKHTTQYDDESQGAHS